MLPVAPVFPHPLGVGAVGIAAAVLSKLGYQIADPFDHRLAFDLLASNDPGLRTWYKIQVKQVGAGGWVSLRRGDKRHGCKRYVSGDFDFLVAVDDEYGTYAVPYAVIQHCRSRVCLRNGAYACYRLAGPIGRVAVPSGLGAAARVRGPEQLHLSLDEPRRAAA